MLVLAFLTIQRKAAARVPGVLLRRNLKQSAVLSSGVTVGGQSTQRTAKDHARKANLFPTAVLVTNLSKLGSGGQQRQEDDLQICGWFVSTR